MSSGARRLVNKFRPWKAVSLAGGEMRLTPSWGWYKEKYGYAYGGVFDRMAVAAALEEVLNGRELTEEERAAIVPPQPDS